MKYYGSGYIEKHTIFPVVTLVIARFSIIIEKVTPFFEKYPLLDIKQKDFLNWYKIAKLMSAGSYLTAEGFKLIKIIKARMNNSRYKE